MDIYERHANNHNQLDECLTALQNMDNMVAKSSIWKFYENCRVTWIKLDQEFITCRRVRRCTLKYAETEKQLNECIAVFQQWHLMAALTY